MRVALVVPHIFMQQSILPQVIFSPGTLALSLAEGLQKQGLEVTLFTPGPLTTTVQNITADLSYFERELQGRGDDYLGLLKKHPFTFITLARQVQSELIAKAFVMANENKFDIVHIYTNEEDIALPFAALCQKPVVFTHHDPFNFLVKYKNVFPKYKHLNWISISDAQRKSMPNETNWLATIHHGLRKNQFQPNFSPTGNYIAYLGRIIQPKGVHLAIKAVKLHNTKYQSNLYLKIAGKHYTGNKKDTYWQEHIKPELGATIEYMGFIDNNADKQRLLGNAKALLMPSLFEEPFGMVMVEALACGTPVIGLDSGAIPEVIITHKNGLLVKKSPNEHTTAGALAQAITQVKNIDRKVCRADFEKRFTLKHMCAEHIKAYEKLLVQT